MYRKATFYSWRVPPAQLQPVLSAGCPDLGFDWCLDQVPLHSLLEHKHIKHTTLVVVALNAINFWAPQPPPRKVTRRRLPGQQASLGADLNEICNSNPRWAKTQWNNNRPRKLNPCWKRWTWGFGPDCCLIRRFYSPPMRQTKSIDRQQ